MREIIALIITTIAGLSTVIGGCIVFFKIKNKEKFISFCLSFSLSVMITISIIDYGQGIPENELKLIFNKYYSAAKKFRKIGTGLGLYLSQQIVKSHGGEITVQSEENVRTEFCIKIPI